MKVSVNVTDKAVVEYLNNSPTPVEDEVNRLLSIAVSVIQRVQVSQDVDFVRKEAQLIVQKFSNDVDRVQENIMSGVKQLIDSVIEPKVKTHLDTLRANVESELNRVKNDMTAITKDVRELTSDSVSTMRNLVQVSEKSFDPNLSTSYLGILKSRVESVSSEISTILDFQKKGSFAEKLDSIIVERFGHDSLLVAVVKDIINANAQQVSESIVNLREEIARREGADAMLQSTAQLKGALFEDELYEKLETIASNFGDIVEHVGKEKETSSSSKKGDVVYTFSDSIPIVIEAKDTPIGVKPMLKYLDEAMSTRNVQFSIIVTKHADQLPKQVGMLEVYNGNKLFTCIEHVEFALRYARLYIKLQRDTVKTDDIDVTEVKKHLDSIRLSFVEMKTMKQKLTTMKKTVSDTVEATSDSLDGMKRIIEATLLEVEEALS